ncbi:MAG: restriction endonuclease subunit S, partial [Bacteroidales bacterium]|nr:restriction endonuclease subunit S [Bacteroidales bacterium]
MKRLNEIFEIKNSPSLELLNCEQIENGICFVSRTSANNGIVARVELLDELEPMPANAITVALGGSVLSSFYQDEPFYTSFHIACLYPRIELTKEQMLYYAYVIEQNKYRYNFGRQANRTLKNILIPDITELPDYVNKISITDYQFEKEPILNKKLPLNTCNWKWFRYDEIFEIKKGKRLTKADQIEGIINFIGATRFNNGITAKIANDSHIHSANTITVSYNGSIAEAFYQDEPFWATDDVNVLYPKFNLNPFIAMFLCTLIQMEKYRYNFGLKWDKENMQQSKIKLPVTIDSFPD